MTNIESMLWFDTGTIKQIEFYCWFFSLPIPHLSEIVSAWFRVVCPLPVRLSRLSRLTLVTDWWLKVCVWRERALVCLFVKHDWVWEEHIIVDSFAPVKIHDRQIENFNLCIVRLTPQRSPNAPPFSIHCVAFASISFARDFCASTHTHKQALMRINRLFTNRRISPLLRMSRLCA